MKYDNIAKKLIIIYEKKTNNDMFKAINLANKKYRIFVGMTEKECALSIKMFMEYILGK